jgi:hypothetical protein
MVKKGMTSSELIQELQVLTGEIIAFADHRLNTLSKEELSWKSSHAIWSIEENMAHLNEYAGYYHPTIIKRIQETSHHPPTVEYVSSPLGKSAWKAMQLGQAKNVKRKLKAPRNVNPTKKPDLVRGDELVRFRASQLEMLQILQLAQDVNLKKVKIPLSISRLVRLRLGDTLRMIVYHAQRHTRQMELIIEKLNLRTA